MKAAIVGLPLSGKTTLFSAVTGHLSDPAGLGQVQRAVAKVPDTRLDALARIFSPKKYTQATVEFIDVPGLDLADARGRDELRRHLPDIRQSELLVTVLRAFENPDAPAYRNRVDPKADLRELHDEFLLADLETLTGRIDRMEKSIRKPTGTHDQEKHEVDVLKACVEALEASKPVSSVVHKAEDRAVVGGYGLLTLKPMLAVYNVPAQRAAEADPPPPEYTVAAVGVCADVERDIAQLEPADRPAFLADLGVKEPARDRLIRRCYEALGLISFLTASEKEVRAWTIRRGETAVEAAGEIHSDIARGFIRAETVAFDDLMAGGDMKAAKAAGKVRQEGKTYVVQDGDIVHFRFNV
ncbi:MAG: redox-regulated ATPase YchF [Phycisphaerales bacterium]|nr:redox-regulated ATPase YchF [Phycisphaerales bacterium]